jgi:hypothetical protein
MKNNKNVIILMTVCIILAMGSVSTMASSVELYVENMNASEVALILESAGITQDEVAQLGGLRGIIASLIVTGQINGQQAQQIIQQHIYGKHSISDATFDSDHLGLSVKSARVLPEFVAVNKTLVINIGNNAIGQLGLPAVSHMYYRLAGSTARANGTDFYEVSFFTQAANVVPEPSIIVYFKGPDGLILDKTVGVTDSAGRVTVKVSTTDPGIYTLTASCSHRTGQKFASAEMEFVSKDVALPTPVRASGEPMDLEPAEPPGSAESTPGAIDRGYSNFEIDEPSVVTDNANAANVKFYAYDDEYQLVKNTAYIATSLGANFWSGDSAWILADGVRLTNVAGGGDDGAFAFPVNGVAVLQFVSTIPASFSVGIGVDELLAADGTLYNYACGNVSADVAQAINVWDKEIQIGTVLQMTDPVLPLPEIAQIKSSDGNVIDFDYSTILPGAIHRDAFVETLLFNSDHPYQLLVYCNDRQWYDVTGITLKDAVRDNRTVTLDL